MHQIKITLQNKHCGDLIYMFLSVFTAHVALDQSTFCLYGRQSLIPKVDITTNKELLRIFLETQLKEEKEQDELLGIIAEKVSEEDCTEQCGSCQKYCPASEECMGN